jgi:hypothetical protein
MMDDLSGNYNDKCKTNTDIPSCNAATAKYNTEPQMGYCVPTKEDSLEAYNMIKEELDKQSGMGQYIVQLKASWEAIAIMSFVTILISLLYIWLLKWITKPLLYVSMLIILLCFLVMAAYGYMVAQEYEKDSDDWKMAMAGAIFCGIVAVLYAVCICCCWKNISLGASIMECASEFVASNSRIVLVPVIAYILVVPIFVMWTFVAVHIYSIGDVTFVEN